MNFENEFKEFGKALGKLKRSYADKYNCNPSYLSIHVDENDYVTIIPTNETGEYSECFRNWADTDE